MTSFLGSIKDAHGYFLITVASILWGTMGVLAKLAYEYGIPPETLVALRLAVSFATLLVFLAMFKKDSLKLFKADASLLLIFGVLAIAFQRVSYFYAVSFTTPTVAAILFYTYPVFVTFFALPLLQEKIALVDVLAIVLTFSGVALVVRVYDVSSLGVSLPGIVFGMLSSILFTLYFIMTKKLRGKYSGWTLTLFGDGIGALTLTPIILFSLPEISGFPLQLWLLIFTIAWVPSLLAYLLYSHALKYVKSSKGSILSVIEPLSAALFSAFFIGESLEALQVIGIAFALTGVVLLFIEGKAIV